MKDKVDATPISDRDKSAKPQTKLRLKNKSAPSMPDWVSIYGTLWAGIKALFQKLTHFQEKITKEIKSLKASIKTQDKTIEDLKNQITKQAQVIKKQDQVAKKLAQGMEQLKASLKEQNKDIAQLKTRLNQVE